ncbi:MAG: DNA mismatch repair protein MutS [Rhodospirillales bacterium]|nr:DNA mismatch repair protein MutS [Rhodospirillales bacterium]
MSQFLAIKQTCPDCLLFYRMGDFYELFFDDAVKAAAALDVALTKRGKHLGQDIAMCGVPVHSHEVYLARLIRQGFRVAVCEQVEDPANARKRGAKSIVRREIVRIVTAGTVTEETLLESRAHNYLAAVVEHGASAGLAWIDVSTGAFATRAAASADVASALAQLEPVEILIADTLQARLDALDPGRSWRDRLTVLPIARFDIANARRRLERAFSVASLDGFGAFTAAEITAAGVLLDYVELTQCGRLPRLDRPQRLTDSAVMEIDAHTRRNLELSRTLGGERKGSLLAAIDRTVTAAGARLLAARLAAPLTDPAAIDARLDLVQIFVDRPSARAALREALKGGADVERALSRLAVGRGGPRDLAAVRDGLALTAELRAILTTVELPVDLAGTPAALEDCVNALGEHGARVGKLRAALNEEPPLTARNGDFIANGYCAELDEARALRDDARRHLAGLQARYATETGVASLKIRFNNVLGYFIEVPARQAEKLAGRSDAAFIHRQTTAGAARFTTVALGELAGRIAGAADQALALELALFDQLVAAVVADAEAIAAAASGTAAVDVAAGLAELAAAHGYVRPVVDEGADFAVRGGRHPVVEAALQAADGRDFVANDCHLDDGRRLWLVTGPNMAGKSTFLRQNALIAILGQIGSYVPAERARFGAVDRLFSRVGAADDLARGQSTFMVEMVETAAILNLAGPRALVILDEIGRGTATFDGLSIAWAVIEHLHAVNRCRTLFATHYHELTALAARLDDLACYTMRIKEWRDDIVFLHEVAAGVADRSYGIHVGRRAGLPPAVVERAEEVLQTLERGETSSAVTRLAADLPLFAAAASRAEPPPLSPLAQVLGDLDADALSPRDALDLVYRLKAML